MAKVIIVGDVYNADARPDQGLPPWQGGKPTHPIVIPPDAIGPGVPTQPIHLPVYPSHPIVIPPGSLAPGTPSHPIYLPVYPSHPIVIPPNAVGPGLPEHPIVLPIYPDQGLPGGQPYPDHTLPGGQPYPDQGLPGDQPHPDQGLPGSQPRPDQGLPAFPSHPIVIPPEAIVPDTEGKAKVVVYYGGQRMTFTVEVSEGKPPTEAQPKRGQ